MDDLIGLIFDKLKKPTEPFTEYSGSGARTVEKYPELFPERNEIRTHIEQIASMVAECSQINPDIARYPQLWKCLEDYD